MICFVILHYQAIEETHKCIETILDNVKEAHKIIIVDNASPNGTGKKLKDEYAENKDIDVILSPQNLGFAKGNNIGYVKAKEYAPEFVVVLNSDIELQDSNFVKELEKAYEKYGFDVLGPDLYSTKTNSHQNPQRNKNYTLEELKKKRTELYIKNRFRFLLRIKYFLHRGDTRQVVHENDYIHVQLGKVLHGAFYVYSRPFIEKHKYCLYNGTFMYFESYILHHLGMKEGLTFLYYPGIKVLHHEDASTNATYKGQYKKSAFVNSCLLDSCQEYIRVYNNNSINMG